MKHIGNNDVLFDLLKDAKVRIGDSEVKRINIFTQEWDDLIIEIDFDHTLLLGYCFRLRFVGIKEFSFYSNDKYLISCVEEFKLLREDGLFYLSIDPEDERATTMSGNDQDFVLCSGIEGFYLE